MRLFEITRGLSDWMSILRNNWEKIFNKRKLFLSNQVEDFKRKTYLDNQKKAEKIKEKISKDFIGTYKNIGIYIINLLLQRSSYNSIVYQIDKNKQIPNKGKEIFDMFRKEYPEINDLIMN